MDEFKEAVVRAATGAGLPADAAREAVTVPRERDRADLTLPCFPFAESMRRPPQAIAAEVAAAFEPSEWLTSAEAAGPFVNFRLDRTRFTAAVLAAIGPDHGRSDVGAGQTIVVEYGSPNIAKPLLFHHLRSAVIGQSLCNLFRWRGYEVVGMTFLGDLGTGFGKLLFGLEEFGEAADADALNETYVKAAALCEEDSAAMKRARAWAKRLEAGDPEARRRWQNARAISLEGFEEVYDWLGVHHDVVDGESLYAERASELVDALLERGKARESDGAIVLEAGKHTLLLRKRDGATLYQTRDLAAVIDRFDRFAFDRALYVVDVAQSHHFDGLFAAVRELGHTWWDRCRHIAFGQVLMGGRRTSTRKGRGVHLMEVLKEGEKRARSIIEEKNAELSDKEAVARAVGVAAVIFCDVGYPSRKNINFDWEEILSFDGRTGPYLQYVHASACSILRKRPSRPAGALEAKASDVDVSVLTHELEWDLVRRLAEFPDAVQRACDECEPSTVSHYLYNLARAFRGYHTAGARDASLRVLTDDGALRNARLRLVAGVRHALAVGLRLLGIEPVEEM